jgi:hypothetical protein
MPKKKQRVKRCRTIRWHGKSPKKGRCYGKNKLALASVGARKQAKSTRMKRALFLFVLFAAAVAVAFAQVPPDWDTNRPRDTAALKYNVGISQPCNTEQDAVKNAWQNAVQQFATRSS